MKAAKGPLFSQISGTETGKRVVRAMIERVVKRPMAPSNGAPASNPPESISIPGVGTFRIGRVRRG